MRQSVFTHFCNSQSRSIKRFARELVAVAIIVLVGTQSAQADVVWTLETTANVTGSITFDDLNANFTPGGTATLGSGIVDFEFIGGSSGSFWHPDDGVLLPLSVNFGIDVSPVGATVQFSYFDNAAPGGTGSILQILNNGVGLFDVNTTADGRDTASTFAAPSSSVPEPASIVFLAIASLGFPSMRRRR